jgi:shikimate dehydrogenase
MTNVLVRTMRAFGNTKASQLPDAAKDRTLLVGTAVAFGLTKEGEVISKSSAEISRELESLVERLAAVFGSGRLSVGKGIARAAVPKANGLINATPTGMAAQPGLAVSEELIQPSSWFAGVVYFTLGTKPVSVAESRGCPVRAGWRYGCLPAVDAFELFPVWLPRRNE